MDIKQALNAVAMITLGKDMNFRDVRVAIVAQPPESVCGGLSLKSHCAHLLLLWGVACACPVCCPQYAQGAFRMRGIGVGQTLKIIMIPEVKKLIVANLASAAGATFADQQKILATEAHLLPQQVSLVDICAWLVINSMKTEKTQFNMLIEQALENVWRKHALSDLFKRYKNVGVHAAGVSRKDRELVLAPADETQLGQAIDTFRDRVDFSIATLVDPPKDFLSKLQQTVREHQQVYIRNANDQRDVDTVVGWVKAAQAKPPAVVDKELQVDEARTEGEANQDRAFNSEQVQEQEQEQGQTAEQQQHCIAGLVCERLLTLDVCVCVCFSQSKSRSRNRSKSSSKVSKVKALTIGNPAVSVADIFSSSPCVCCVCRARAGGG